IREVVVKIGCVDEDAVIPELLPHPNVEAANPLRLEVWIIPENFVLAGWRTEPGCIAGMQNCVRRFEFVIASDPPSPDVAKLVEMIVATARDQIQALEGHDACLQESRGLLGVIADECWLRPKLLGNEWPFLPGIDLTVEKPARQGEPARGPEVVLVIDR